MWNIIEDLKYGKIREKYVVKYLNEDIYMNDKLKLYQNEKKQVDFRNEEIVGELKSRTCTHSFYDTTFFGYNKIEYLIESKDKRVWKFYFYSQTVCMYGITIKNSLKLEIMNTRREAGSNRYISL